MKLYVNHFGQWAGNQDDARSYGHPFDQVEVPYDKKGLLEFLNENKVTVGLPDNVPSPLVPTSVEKVPEKDYQNWCTSVNATRYDIHDAALNAPLKELGVALAVYMNRVDEELSK
mgnify:CR=1 FL=1|jgi:hypothetical protein